MLTEDREAPAAEARDEVEPQVQAEWRRRRGPVARVVGSVGRLLITSGVVVLLLVAYQLWGTGLQTARSQQELADEFAALEDETASEAPEPAPAPPPDPDPAPDAGGTAPVEVAPTIPPPAVGDVIGSYRIPAIGVNAEQWTVEGTGTDQLKRGSAHYPGTPLPGQSGNAAVAGHRTTYGAPLKDVDDLVPGDQIFFTTLQGEFTYEVTGLEIVTPDEVSVLEDKGDDRLTLTACHPEFSAKERIIVTAVLVGNPVPPLEGQAEAAPAELDAIDEFATEPALTFPGAWWGLVCMGLWVLVRISARLVRRFGRGWVAVPYLLGTPVCLVVLYLFFESFSYEGFARSVGLG